MIESLRQREYPGSEIILEETLEPAGNYSRQIVSYQSEGLRIYAYLTIPIGEKPPNGWPLIIFNHGFVPPSEYQTTYYYLDYIDALARSGYIVFASDYRGHGRSDGDGFEAYSNPDFTIDVLNGLESMKRHPDVDPDRIGMWAHSMGGIITLRAMVTRPDIKAGVIWGGVVGSYTDIFDWMDWWLSSHDITAVDPAGSNDETDSPKHILTNLISKFGSWDVNPHFWDAISPTTYLADLSGPLQLHHGTADSEVYPQLSEKLYARLQESALPAELYLYEYDNHNLSGNFGTAMQRTLEFFDRHLQ